MNRAFKILGYLTTEEGSVRICEDVFSSKRIRHTVPISTPPEEGYNYLITDTSGTDSSLCVNYEDRASVLPGIHYTNLKNHNTYKVIGVGVNTTNKDDGITMVSYIPLDGDPIEPYIRTLDEFRTKFCVTLYPPMRVEVYRRYKVMEIEHQHLRLENDILVYIDMPDDFIERITTAEDKGSVIYDNQLVPHHFYEPTTTTLYGCKYDTQGDK